jgi:uncharacterized membrane protein YfcA
MESLALLVSIILAVVFASFCLATYTALRKKAISSQATRWFLSIPCVLSALGGIKLISALDATVMRVAGFLALMAGLAGLVKLWNNKP